MATLTANKAASTVQPRAGIDITAVYSAYTIAAAVALNDVFQMAWIPKGATVLNGALKVPALDSSTGVTVDVGDGSDTDRYIASSTIGRSSAAGVVVWPGGTGQNTAGFTYTYTTTDTIDILLSVGPSGTAASSGEFRLFQVYTMAQ